jgi:hypothetical protein
MIFSGHNLGMEFLFWLVQIVLELIDFGKIGEKVYRLIITLTSNIMNRDIVLKNK